MTISRLETITMDGEVGIPGLVFLNNFTDDGVIEHDKTYYIPPPSKREGGD